MNKKYKELVKAIIPIHENQLAKFLSFAALIFLICYIHSILHIAKDALVISHLGAESISAIKMWIVLPISLVFMFLYIKLSDKFSRSQLFHFAAWFFISYFVLFTLVLYPHADLLSININSEITTKLTSFRYLFQIISNWHYTLFFVFSESWTVIMLTISFWQTANHLTTIEESKSFYPLFSIFAGVGKMAAAFLSGSFVATGLSWQPTLNHTTISIVISGIAISVCLVNLERITGKEAFNFNKGHFKPKSKITLKDSLKYIMSSKIILLITSMLLCYSISVNLLEGVWKKSIEVFFVNDANKIHHFISRVDIYTSTLNIVGGFFGVYILRFFKWKTSALLTPIIFFITGALFFMFFFLMDHSPLGLKSSFLGIAVYLGAACTVLLRASKFALFDPTKEMLYIPLDDDLQSKGKAAAETIGLRFGKGSGAFIQQILLAIFPTLTLIELSPIIFAMFFITLLFWFLSVNASNRVSTGIKSMNN